MKAASLALLALAGPLLSLSTTALAATRSWDGGGGADTDWTTDANWSLNIEHAAWRLHPEHWPVV